MMEPGSSNEPPVASRDAKKMLRNVFEQNVVLVGKMVYYLRGDAGWARLCRALNESLRPCHRWRMPTVRDCTPRQLEELQRKLERHAATPAEEAPKLDRSSASEPADGIRRPPVLGHPDEPSALSSAPAASQGLSSSSRAPRLSSATSVCGTEVYCGVEPDSSDETGATSLMEPDSSNDLSHLLMPRGGCETTS